MQKRTSKTMVLDLRRHINVMC